MPKEGTAVPPVTHHQERDVVVEHVLLRAEVRRGIGNDRSQGLSRGSKYTGMDVKLLGKQLLDRFLHLRLIVTRRRK
jgi:hypothetical protein